MNVLLQFEHKPLAFTKPLAIVCCDRPSAVHQTFALLQEWLQRGYYVAGFVAYEAGYCFEPCFHPKEVYDFPLICFGVYSAPTVWAPKISARPFQLKHLRLSSTFSHYAQHIGRIREHIAQGDVYQITYCLKLFCDFDGDARDLYTFLLRQQPVPYAAYLEYESWRILSLSPERFLKKTAHTLLTEPMKGTWMRGENIFSDAMARWHLYRDEKNRAENVMIADLLRNDVGRIATQIRAPKLFTVAGYKTLYQMTSTVTGTLRTPPPWRDIFQAIFPSGSVTGAPKIRAMQIIRDLEPFERKIYTGAIGYITPQQDCYFNIPIRTILVQGRQVEMGIGGGIVWDSTPEGEWQEGLLKARFLTDHIHS